MIVKRVLAFCATGFAVVMALVYGATHFPPPAADRQALRAAVRATTPVSAPELLPATESARRLEYGPAPDFVRPVPMPDPGTAQAPLFSGARLLLVDLQHDAGNPQAGLYTRQVTQAVTGAGVAAISSYQVSIDPRYQRLVIHDAAIIRDGERQSREGRIAADFLRQEPALAAGLITGMEIALLRFEDVREGDILDLSFSVTGINPLLAPHQTRVFPLASLPDIEQLSVRTTWPRGTAHRVLGTDDDPVTLERSGNRTSFVLSPRPTAALSLEEGAPPEHLQMPVLVVSSWPDWASVARWGEAFYVIPAEPEQEVAAIAERIRDAHGAPARQLMAALDYVQDEIRYQAVLLGDSTYVPTPVSETLRVRTGDCKAKTLLLLSILDALGIEAYPVLAHSETGRGLGRYPPSPQMFNHVFVQARLDGRVFWLEPAATGQRGTIFHRSQPDYGEVLVLDGVSSALTDMTPQEPPLASTVYLETFELLDQELTEALEWTLEVTHRGVAADEWRALIRQAGLGQIEQAFTSFYESYRRSAELLSPLQVDDDEETNTLVMRASWSVAPLIGPPDTTGRREIRLRPHSLGDMLASTNLERTAPVITAYPLHRRHIIEGGIDVPGSTFWDLQDTRETLVNEAFEFSYEQTYDGGLLTLVYDQRALVPSVMLDEALIEDHRRMRQLMRAYVLWLNAPELDAQEAAEGAKP